MSRRVNVSLDIKPVSEFRANAADLIDQIRKSKRPLVLTQRGHSAAVVLDVAEYERMVEEIELLSDVRTALQQIESGQGVANDDAKAELRRRFRAVRLVWSPLAIERAYEAAKRFGVRRPSRRFG